MAETQNSSNAWRRFWNRGGWWRALLVAVLYLAVYNGVGLLLAAAFPGRVDADNVFGSAESVLFGLALPILLGGALPMLLFALSLGWWPELFRRQPISGRGWMWIAVVLVLVPAVLRAAGTDWAAYSVTTVLATLLVGVAVGFTEEIVTRGFAVNLLRKAGHGEKTVAVLSSLIFALLHSLNVFSGQQALTVILTMVYTFGFGMMMYLVLRVTGRLIWPMVLHGLTDPTTFLATGGLDSHGASGSSDGLISIAGIFNGLYPVLGLLALIIIHGHVSKDRAGDLR